MSDMDYKLLGKEIARSMSNDGHINKAIKLILPPLLEENNKKVIEDIRAVQREDSMKNGFDCDDWKENQKDFAFIRTERRANDGNIRKMKEWGFGISLAGIAAFLGLDKLV